MDLHCLLPSKHARFRLQVMLTLSGVQLQISHPGARNSAERTEWPVKSDAAQRGGITAGFVFYVLTGPDG